MGDVGSDVATVHVEGIDFPFPGYLQNIQRQVILNFKPSDTNSALRAEVLFLIYRDGSVKIVRFVTRSHSYAFDLEAHEAAPALVNLSSLEVCLRQAPRLQLLGW